MSYDTEKLADQAAARMLEQLPEGWVSRVWQNLGWHAAARCGTVEVHISASRRGAEPTFYALVSPDAGRAGTGLASWTPERTTPYTHPLEAARAAVDAAHAYVERLARACLEAEQAMQGKLGQHTP